MLCHEKSTGNYGFPTSDKEKSDSLLAYPCAASEQHCSSPFSVPVRIENAPDKCWPYLLPTLEISPFVYNRKHSELPADHGSVEKLTWYRSTSASRIHRSTCRSWKLNEYHFSFIKLTIPAAPGIFLFSVNESNLRPGRPGLWGGGSI